MSELSPIKEHTTKTEFLNEAVTWLDCLLHYTKNINHMAPANPK